MTRTILFFGLGLVLATAAFAEAPTMSVTALHSRQESGTAPVVLDVRSPAEYTSGHIPGAINIPFDQVAKRLDEVDASQDIAVYCGVGPRARKGEAALLSAGYKKVFHVGGGFTAWKAAGLPVEVPR